jgi:hypothetical protein
VAGHGTLPSAPPRAGKIVPLIWTLNMLAWILSGGNFVAFKLGVLR